MELRSSDYILYTFHWPMLFLSGKITKHSDSLANTCCNGHEVQTQAHLTSERLHI